MLLLYTIYFKILSTQTNVIYFLFIENIKITLVRISNKQNQIGRQTTFFYRKKKKKSNKSVKI